MELCGPSTRNPGSLPQVQLPGNLTCRKSEKKSANSSELPSSSQKIAITNVRSLKKLQCGTLGVRKNNRSLSLLKILRESLTCTQYEFVLSLIKNSLKQGKNRHWTVEEKSLVIEIYNQSFSAYKLLRKFLAFPSKSTIKRSINILKSSEFCPKLTSCLYQLVSKMKPKDRFCTLTFDEMPLRKKLSYNLKSDSIDGFVSQKNNPQHASKALVFMLQGISKRWKQVLGYFFLSDGERNEERKEYLYKALLQAESCGLRVISVVCCPSLPNQTLMKDFQVTTEKPFFIFNKKRLFVIWDPPHLLKSVRNALQRYKIYFSYQDEINCTGFASWEHIQQLFEVDTRQEYRLCPKLTRAHVEAISKDEENFELAAQVLSYSVAAALYAYALPSVFEVDNIAVETAQFVGMVDKIFDSVNSSAVCSWKPFAGVVKERSGHVEFWSDTIEFIKSWRVLSPDGKLIPFSLQIWWITTLKAFAGLWGYLKNKGFESLLLRRFNMDCLVDTFESLKRHNFQCNLDCQQFSKAIHAELVKNVMRKSPHKSCLDCVSEDLLDFGKLKRKSMINIIDEEPDELADHNNSVFPDKYFEKENLPLYIAGFIAKEYCKLHGCEVCMSLIMCAKAFYTGTAVVFVKEFASGLNWPSEKFENYIQRLSDSCGPCFDFHLEGMRRTITKKLFHETFDLFEKHKEHQNVAQTFFIQMFTDIKISRHIYAYNKMLKTF